MKVRYCTGGVSILAKTLVEAITCGVPPQCVSPDTHTTKNSTKISGG